MLLQLIWAKGGIGDLGLLKFGMNRYPYTPVITGYVSDKLV